MDRCLQRIDEFDLEEYIRVIHFDAMKAPTSPIQLPTARFYTGLSELIEAQLDFLKAMVVSRSASAIVTRNKSPVIHFAIQHPKMCAAIENMVLPLIEPLTEERSAET